MLLNRLLVLHATLSVCLSCTVEDKEDSSLQSRLAENPSLLLHDVLGPYEDARMYAVRLIRWDTGEGDALGCD